MFSKGLFSKTMRILILSLMIVTGLCGATAAYAQPALSETPATQQAAPATLPDLSPDVIKKETPGYQAPSSVANEEKSVIVPSQEPWRKEKPKRQDGRSAEEVFATLPADIQKQILDEAEGVNRQCNQYNLYSQFHNCECLGTRYFEERVFNPEASKDTIVGEISGECASIAGVAGYGYDMCVTSMRKVLVQERLGAYCTCYANTLAEGYKQNPYPDFDNLRGLGQKANSVCIRKVPGAIVGMPSNLTIPAR